MAAEIAGGKGGEALAQAGFNEAAANGRGNHGYREPERPRRRASMRPRRMAAEISNEALGR